MTVLRYVVPPKSRLSTDQLTVIRTASERGDSHRSIARGVGVSPATVTRALARAVQRTRTANEFKGGAFVQARRRDQTRVSWSLESIRTARDAQLRGDFSLPVQLARAMRTDGALFVAYSNRIAPQSAIATKLVPCDNVRGAAVARKATQSVFVPGTLLKSIQGTLANHGLAVGYVLHEANEDGTRVDFRLTEWPLEHVRWNNSEEQLQTTTREGIRENIVHGDGRWVVFRKTFEQPWQQEACVLPAALLWAMHTEAAQDWAGASRSHGQPKLVGELPAGVAMQVKATDGTIILTPEALAFSSMLQDLVSGDVGAGVRPAGAKTDLLANGSTAWQVFSELMNNTEKIAARIYLGTDAILGSVGGAPGVDIATLFGVASTILQGDFTAIEQGLNTGVYQPWTAVNEGDSRYAPSFRYQLPDPDAAEKSAENSAKLDRLFAALDKYAANNMTIDQGVVNRLAALIGLEPGDAPALATANRPSIALDPADVGAITRGFEARQAQGLAPFGDERDNMTIPEIAIVAKAKADIRVAEIKAAATEAGAGPAAPAVPGAATDPKA